MPLSSAAQTAILAAAWILSIASLAIILRTRWATRPFERQRIRATSRIEPGPPAALAFAVAHRSDTESAEAEPAPGREQRVAHALLRLATDLPSSSDLDVILDKALALAGEFLGAESGLILIADPDRDKFTLRSTWSVGGPSPGHPSAFAHAVAAQVLVEHAPMIVDDRQTEGRWTGDAGAAGDTGSALAVPLSVDDETLGVMLFMNAGPDAFEHDQLPVALAAAGQASAALYNAELFRLIRDQAARHGGIIREKRMEESKAQAVFESTAEGLLFTNADNEIALVNAAAEHILGLDRQQALGQAASDLIGVYGEAGDQWMQAVRSWNESPEPTLQDPDPIESRLTLEDGRIVALTVAPVLFDHQFIGTVTTFRDITREVEVDRLKSEFVATVSHELRTPMTSVKGYVEMLLMGAVGDVNDEQRHFLKIIKGNIDRLGSLVNDLLDISRIEAGRVRLSIEPVSLPAMLHETREAFLRRSRLDSKPMKLEVDVPEDLPPLEADRNRLRQVVNNLVENSFNYTPADGTIWLSAHADDDEIEITVRDNGIGIAPTEQERIFERFFRGEQALNLSVAGTGLGLSIVRQLVEMHNGRITLSSPGVAGEGTTFTVVLPRRQSTPPSRDAT
jgi:PAS domain S-box-containing protein